MFKVASSVSYNLSLGFLTCVYNTQFCLGSPTYKWPCSFWNHQHVNIFTVFWDLQPLQVPHIPRFWALKSRYSVGISSSCHCLPTLAKKNTLVCYHATCRITLTVSGFLVKVVKLHPLLQAGKSFFFMFHSVGNTVCSSTR